MRTNVLNAKHCKYTATFYAKIIPIDREEKIYYDKGVPFKIGFIRGDNKHEYNIPNIRTIGTSHTIHTFRNLEVKTGDRIAFDNKDYFVEDVNYSYYESSHNRLVKQYFMTIK